MQYIELTQDDINYINNRAVICYYNNSFVLYEPIPEALQDYFADRERKEVKEVDTTIKSVRYDWDNNKAYILIADEDYPDEIEFDCTTDWTTQDCQNAINSKFNKL
jgi:hypothetical protein